MSVSICMLKNVVVHLKRVYFIPFTGWVLFLNQKIEQTQGSLSLLCKSKLQGGQEFHCGLQ